MYVVMSLLTKVSNFRSPHINDNPLFSNLSTLEIRALSKDSAFLTENAVCAWTRGRNAEKSVRFHSNQVRVTSDLCRCACW